MVAESYQLVHWWAADLLIILVHAFAAILSKTTKKGTLTLGGAPVR